MPLPQMNTVASFPTGSGDPDLIAFAKVAIDDGTVRTIPDNEESKAFIAQLRNLTDEADRKLKTRTTAGVIYFQVLKESPKRRNGSRRSTNGSAAANTAANTGTASAPANVRK